MSHTSILTRTAPTKSIPGETNLDRLLKHLHRGGSYSHLWTDAGNQSHWFRTTEADFQAKRIIPKSWWKHNIFFAVHPLSQIPPRNTSGKQDTRYISSQLPYIAAINTLFAEYDGKDYIGPSEFEPYLPLDFDSLKKIEQRIAIRSAKEAVFYTKSTWYKRRAWAVIRELHYAPNVIIDSGGGYHCYWLLQETVPVDETNRSDIQAIQHSWVQMVRADPGAADLRRVLRLPGTYNRKPGFGNHPPKVLFVKADFERLYKFNELDEAVNDWRFESRPHRAENRTRSKQRASDDVRTRFNQAHSIIELLIAHSYQITFEAETLTRLSRPGRKWHQSSVVVFPGQENGIPERSIHFSTNDELFSDEYIHPETGRVRRRVRDAFYIYVMLVHDGDWRAAYIAAQEEQSEDEAIE